MEMLTTSLNLLSEKMSPLGDTRHVNTSNNPDEELPDDDAIKMFVGQVPRSMDEDALKAFFEEYGPVHQLNVLRDKSNGVSRGCCFVTFFKRKHALDAQNALHNVKTMPGMHHPIQMKPADTENRNERKIFVGMVSKKLSEEDVKTMFCQFGPIEDCTVLRDDGGISRGCAFVTFANRQIAILAIKAMHHSLTMEGCSSPLVVKFADTQKDKEQKKIQQMQQCSLLNVSPFPSQPCLVGIGGQSSSASSYMGGVLGSPLTISQPAQQGNIISLQTLLAQQQLLQQQQQQYLPQHDQVNGTILGSQDMGSSDLSQLTLMSLLQQHQTGMTAPLQSYLAHQPGPQSSTLVQTLAPSMAPTLAPTLTPSLAPSLAPTLAGPGFAPALAPFTGSSQSVSTNNNTMAYFSPALHTGGKIKTPDGTTVKQAGMVGGCTEGANNLFIYHLPQEFTDSDLVQTFQPFGSIVSAKVFIDKQTNLSKCFGFVSYTTSESAQAAIQAMNGFQVGTKRLKVQIKKPKDASKPY